MRGATESLPSHIILAKGDSGKLYKVAAEHREDGSGYLMLNFIIDHEPDVSQERARSRLFPAFEDILGLRFEALKAWRADEASLPGRLLAEAEAWIEVPQAPRSLFNLKTAVERFKIPFAQSLSKGERNFESHPMGERRTAAHASTLPGTNGCSAFQLPFLGSSASLTWIDDPGTTQAYGSRLGRKRRNPGHVYE